MSLTAIVGEKVGMTQIFDEEARALPVTVIKAGPCRIVQIRTPETDGYSAVQLGHYDKAGLEPARRLVEVRVDDVSEFAVGQEIKVEDIFQPGGKADVTGVSKGKGFQGVMKRHNFRGQKASHGAHKIHRAPGAIGACATPARVFKGTKLPGRMGAERVTVLNLAVVGVDAEQGLLLLQGAVPGPKGAMVFVREAVKNG